MAKGAYPWKYPGGRTMAEATAAGDWFRLRKANGVVSDCPGTGSIEEALHAARMNGTVSPGDVLIVERYLPGSTIGFSILDNHGTITA